MDMNFCRRCGSPLTHKRDHVFACANGHTLYANSSPAVAFFLLNERNEVLVAMRALDPGKGQPDIPGGFCDKGETLEEAGARELVEELGITPDQYTTPAYLGSGIDPYEFSGELLPVLCGLFWARVKPGRQLTINPADDVSSANFLPLTAPELEKLYFPSLHQGLAKLREIVQLDTPAK